MQRCNTCNYCNRSASELLQQERQRITATGAPANYCNRSASELLQQERQRITATGAPANYCNRSASELLQQERQRITATGAPANYCNRSASELLQQERQRILQRAPFVIPKSFYTNDLQQLLPIHPATDYLYPMEKMMRKNWWKILGALLVMYGLVAGLLVPLKPNLVSVSPRIAELGQTVTLEVVGYNTSFGADAGAVKGWLRAGDELSIVASKVEVWDDRRATLTFDLPPHLADPTLDKQTFPIIINSPADGAFVDPIGLTVRQELPAATVEAAEAPWRVTALKKGDLSATPRTTFPYRGHLAETIRNIYFHVSLWFAMMFVFIAAAVYAIKYLRRSGKVSDELPDVVSLRDKADYWSVSFTSVGMLFGVLGLATGAVWAKYTWGSFWSWDIKQFTTLIALLIYAGYFVLRASFPDPEQRARLGAAYNIFAFVCLIPLIYILPRLSGNSLHPGAAGNPAFGGEDLDNTMRMVFYPIIIGWTLFGFWMAGVAYRARLLRERMLLKEH